MYDVLRAGGKRERSARNRNATRLPLESAHHGHEECNRGPRFGWAEETVTKEMWGIVNKASKSLREWARCLKICRTVQLLQEKGLEDFTAGRWQMGGRSNKAGNREVKRDFGIRVDSRDDHSNALFSRLHE